ncbi:MAG: hypothetical protein M1836_000002 [Candelina mexicana]|nr:MAG: hypothetical protein M1836_000002 [Candelina mexicana]
MGNRTHLDRRTDNQNQPPKSQEPEEFYLPSGQAPQLFEVPEQPAQINLITEFLFGHDSHPSDPSSSLDMDEFTVSLIITNPNPESSVYLLMWNSILESDSYNYSPAELGISLTSPFDRAAESSPAEGRTHKRYGIASIKNSFIKIGPSEEFRTQRWASGSVWSWVRSRQPYHAGKYTLRLDTQVHGFEMSANEAPEHLDDGNFFLKRSAVSELPIAALTREIEVLIRFVRWGITMEPYALNARDQPSSQHEPGKTYVPPKMTARQGEHPSTSAIHSSELLSDGSSSGLLTRRDPRTCDSVRTVAVGVARVRARALADYTRLFPDEILWQEYNYGPPPVQHAVAEAYNNIVNYGVGEKNSLLTELCGYTLRPCNNPDLVAYTDRVSKLVFCDSFFTMPAFLECDCQSIHDMDMVDRSGVFLHELSHVDAVNKNIGGIGVHDGNPRSKGKPGQCYGWGCITNAARNRPAPRADNSMPPNDWQKKSKDGLPENIADFYELHAYAIRAKQCSKRKGAQQQYCQVDKDCGIRGKCKKFIKKLSNLLSSLLFGIATIAPVMGACV